MKRGLSSTSCAAVFLSLLLIFFFSACDSLTSDTSSKDVAVTGVTLNKGSTTIKIGSTEQLTATVAPADATNKVVTWSSSDSAKATVSSNGLVAAMAEGTATITVTTESGNKTAACTVVIPAPTAAEIAGIWLVDFDPSTFDYDGAASTNVADAMLFQIDHDGTNTYYTMWFFFDTAQVGGNRGSLAVSGANLNFTPSYSWSPNSWNADTAAMPSFPFTLTSDALTLSVGVTQIPLLKKQMSYDRPELFGTWIAPGGYTLSINPGETYSYAETGYTENGRWTATGSTSGYIRTEATHVNSVSAVVYGLASFTLSGNTLSLMHPDGVKVYTKQ